MPTKKSPNKSRIKSTQQIEATYEAEILNGLKSVAYKELKIIFGDKIEILPTERDDQLTFTTSKTHLLKYLKIPIALFTVLNFEVSSPTKLSSPDHWSRLTRAIKEVRTLGTFRTFRISAAGSDSPFFKKLASQIEEYSGLRNDPNNGGMVLRFRPSLINRGWDVLIRRSPKPLSARPWRKVNIPGAINGTLAAAMVVLSDPSPNDLVCSALCGTGTFLVERHLAERSRKLFGFDLSSEMISAAKTNIVHAKVPATLVKQDIYDGISQFGPFDVIFCDLPYGKLIGNKHDLPDLYRTFIEKAWEASNLNARMVLITQEVKLIDQILKEKKDRWSVQERIRVKQDEFLPVMISCRRS